MTSSPRRLQAELEPEDFSSERLYLARVSGRGRVLELSRVPDILVEKGPPRVTTKPSGVVIEINDEIREEPRCRFRFAPGRC